MQPKGIGATLEQSLTFLRRMGRLGTDGGRSLEGHLGRSSVDRGRE